MSLAHDKHPCAVCSKPINRGLLMCAPHWRLVPPREQAAVNSTFRAMTRAAREPGGIQTVMAYRQAREAAIRAVESQVTNQTEESHD